jgi:hypothetical protein
MRRCSTMHLRCLFRPALVALCHVVVTYVKVRDFL